MARLVQPGKHGSWIASSLNWAKLDSYGYHPTHSAAQLQLLRELLGLYRARADRSFYYSSYSGERSIELSAVDSSRLWPLLDEAEKAGLQLVYWPQARCAGAVPGGGALPRRHPARG